MSMMSIGLSGLLVNQRLLQLTGQNVASADVQGYHRQVAVLAPRVTAGGVGLGVQIQQINRIVNQALEDAILRNTSAAAMNSTQLTALQHLEAYLNPVDGSLRDLLERFFNEAQQLTAQPDSIAQRRVVLTTAQALADRLNTTVDEFDILRNGLVNQATQDVSEANALADEIARLNQRILERAAVGQDVNELMDQRDQAVTGLSQLVDVRTVAQDFGQVNVFVAGTPLVLNSTARHLVSEVNNQNQLVIRVADSQNRLEVAGGSLGGTLTLFNSVIPQARADFDAFANGLIAQLDGIHASGLGTTGPMTSLTGQRVALSTTLPLAQAQLAFPPSAGDLHVTVTDFATGQRALNRVAFDPSTQSLADLAASLSAIANLQAVVDPQAGTLSLIAAPGYGFDFTGSLSTRPDTQTLTGTTAASIAGRYRGAGNVTLQFTFVGSGTVGSTPNLALEVRNAAGTLLTTLNIGQGYEAGAELPDVLGVRIALATGTANSGDTFSVNVAANPDATGLLAALGLNTLFSGSTANDVAVRPDLLANPERFALSATGQPGDGTVLAKLIAQRDRLSMNGQTQTLGQFFDNLLGDVGSQTRDGQVRQNAYDSLGRQLDEQRQSISGVDANEELLRMVQFQRSYQMSARYLTVVNQTLDELVNLVR